MSFNPRGLIKLVRRGLAGARALPALFLLLALPALPALSAESPLSFALQVDAGLFYGQTDEYVYQADRERELSRLEWEEHTVPFINLRGTVGFRNFFVTVDVLTTIPIQSGNMRDYDYMLAGSDALSNFSEHEIKFGKHVEIFPQIGYVFQLGRWSLAPAVGFLYRDREWNAVGGYTQYAAGVPWSADIPKETFTGSIVSYEATIMLPTLSLVTGYSITRRFEVGFDVCWYPYLSLNTTDTHYLRKTVFYDTMRGGMGVAAELELIYHPVSIANMDFSASFGFEGIYPQKGTTASSSIGYDTGLVAARTASKMVTTLFWFSLGIVITPQRI
jgi:outer membrane protease